MMISAMTNIFQLLNDACASMIATPLGSVRILPDASFWLTNSMPRKNGNIIEHRPTAASDVALDMVASNERSLLLRVERLTSEAWDV